MHVLTAQRQQLKMFMADTCTLDYITFYVSVGFCIVFMCLITLVVELYFNCLDKLRGV